MSLSAAPLLLSVMPQTCRLFTCLPLLVLSLSLLQVYRHSYMASYSIYNIHTR